MQSDCDHDDRLLNTAAAFVAEGIRAGEPALVLATEDHRAEILQRLEIEGINVEEARASAGLTLLDADHMLGLIVLEGLPDRDRFNQFVGGSVAEGLRRQGAPLVRVYSEMVDSLFKRGDYEAATELEAMFYTLGQTHQFSLLCGFAMRSFYQQSRRPDWPSGESDALTNSAPGTSEERSIPVEPRITQREADVLRQTALGYGNKDIANALNISVRTVEAHKANAMRKLHLAERPDVVRFALAYGWLDHPR
jgi:DNA-binding CsgD family transcriptional regulator